MALKKPKKKGIPRGHLDPIAEDKPDPDDPNLTVPIPRYNAMLAVLRNTLYVYVIFVVVGRSAGKT